VTKRARVLFAVFVVAALGFTACGGDDDDVSADSGSSSTIDEGKLEDAARAAGVDKECLAGIQAYTSIGASAGAAFGGGSDELEKSVKAFQSYAEKAPKDIRADVQVVADAYAGYFQAVVDSGWDPSSGTAPTEEQASALSAAGEKIDSADVKTAGDHVSAYFDEHCKASVGD
jgi:hypothetical protein